jgi:hypothetical protein
MLIIGIIIVNQFVLYGIIFYIVGGWLLPPHILPFIFVGGIGIVYGSFRTVRGSSVTKQFVKATLIKMRNGAIAGSAIAFVVLQIAQVSANHDSWYNWLNGVIPSLIIDIPGALFFGISAGGIGGLILGNIWKNNKAICQRHHCWNSNSFLYISIYTRSLVELVNNHLMDTILFAVQAIQLVHPS